MFGTMPLNSYFCALAAVTILSPLPACNCVKAVRPDGFTLDIPDLSDVHVVPFRWMADAGGSAVIVDDHRLLTARHVVSGFMLEAFESGGMIELVNEPSPVPFTGLVMDFGPEVMSSTVRPGAGCALTVQNAGSTDMLEDDWALLGTDQGSCFSLERQIDTASMMEVAPGTVVYLIGYPASVNAAPERVVLAGRIVDPAEIGVRLGTDSSVSDQLLLARLDRPGDYRGMSGGAVVIRDPGRGSFKLAGLILGSGPGKLCDPDGFALIRRVPSEMQ